MMKNRTFILSLVIIGVLLISFTSIVKAEEYYYLDIDELYDANSIFNNDANMNDRDTGTYAYSSFSNQPNWFYLNETSVNTNLWGFRIWGAVVTGVMNNYQMEMQLYDDTDTWVTLFNESFTHSQWSFYNLSIPITYPLIQKEFRFQIHNMPGRSTFRLYEIEMISVLDPNPSSIGNPLCGGISELWGEDCFGLEPDVYGLVRDSYPNPNNVTLQIWIKNIDTGIWFKAYEKSDGTSFCYHYGGKYFNKYSVEYTYSINRTDDFSVPDCQIYPNDWTNSSFSFTILPRPLDKCEENESLPMFQDSPDCWEMHSLNYSINISRTNLTAFYFYNASNPGTEYTWTQASANNIIYNGLFWWNSTSQSYDNVSWFEPLKGYWIYFYDKNWTIGSNFSCCACETDIDESMSTSGWKNFSLDFESWANISCNVWFNDTNPDTLEFSLSLINHYINNTGGAGCTGIVWVNYSDDNLTFNVSIDKATDANTSTYNIKEDNYLYIAGLALEPEILTLIVFMFFFSVGYNSKKRSGGGFMLFSGFCLLAFEFLVISILHPALIIPLISPIALFIIILGIRKLLYPPEGEKTKTEGE